MGNLGEDNLDEERSGLETRLARREGPAGEEEFRHRVLGAVSAELHPRWWKHRRWLAAAAACFALAVAVLIESRTPPTGPPETASVETRPAPVADETPLPTIMAYRRAMKLSPQHLETLLARHGRDLLPHVASEEGPFDVPAVRQ